MNNLISASKLSFLAINDYAHELHNFFDASSSPRPHFCMAILRRGRARFHDCDMGSDIDLLPGDVIFVVQGGCYTSEWWGEPDVLYTSIHFSFEFSGAFPKNGKFFLQKVEKNDLPDDIGENYERMLRSCGEDRTFSTLEYFYKILSAVEPHLKFTLSKATDLRIADAVEYIEQNFARVMTVDELAAHANMSASRFYPKFREHMGVTPIEYINQYRVNRAILLLIADESLSIEDIAERTGFESSAYFRRVFKKITGISPRKYRDSAIEI